MTDVIFYFDFGSPNAYLAHRIIPEIERRGAAHFVYTPILLGGLFKITGNASPMVAFAGVPAKLAYERRQTQRFIAQHRIGDFAANPHFPVNTLQIMRGAVAAQRLGVFTAYVEAVYRAMWAQGLEMDDPVVIRDVLETADLPAGRLIDLMADAAVKAELTANTEAAAANGAFGSPSFLVAGQLFFGKDRLREVEEEAALAQS